MADIDEVIARAQRSGKFGNRRSFTLESSRAFEKMRKFALPNPHHYILELVQGAVANGAEYLDIALEPDRLGLSYVGSGSGFSASQLEGIFEALFSPQAHEEDADRRGFAMAFNTLYSLGFSRIIVESGDGTLEGSSRLEITGDQISVGAPSSPLRGTFVVVEGGSRDPEIEERLLTERCLSSTIPICLNGKFLSIRTDKFPMPFGYRRCLRFDEGDLYGTIGINSLDRRASFKVMVNGVHLWSFPFPDAKGTEKLGGLICFNRLRKTVDHADVVRDEVWDELWARLTPYGDFVCGRASEVVQSQIQVLGDPEPTLLRQAQKRLSGATSLILVDPRASDFEKGRADVVAELLEAWVVLVPRALVSVVASMVKSHVFVIAPELKDASVMSFFNQDFENTPEGIGAKRSLPVLNLNDFASPDLAESYAGPLPGSSILGQLYYAGNLRNPPDGIRVRFLAFGRLLWEGVVESTHRGVHLEVTLPSITPAQLERDYGARELASRLIAAWIARIESYLEDERALMLETGVEPLTSGAHTALARLESGFTLGFKEVHGSQKPDFRCWQEKNAPLAQLTVFRTLTGDQFGLEDLPELMMKGSGLVYGVRVKEGSLEFAEFVDLEGLDRDRILLVDQTTEDALITLLGEASYVRVDRRDVLAEVDGIVLRDVALGLRRYAAGLLLVEWKSKEVPLASEIQVHQGRLIDQLMEPVSALIESVSAGVWSRPSAEVCEWLRQATRHLQWAAIHSEALELSAEQSEALLDLQLFVSADNALVSLRQLLEREVVRVLEGVAQDLVQVAMDAHLTPIAATPGEELVLAMNPFVVSLLDHRVKVRSAVAHKKLHASSLVVDGGAIVSHQPLGELSGIVGVAPPETDAVVVITRKGSPSLVLSGKVLGLRMFGQLHLPQDAEPEATLVEMRRALLAKLEQAGRSETLARMNPLRREAVALALLDYLGAHVRWVPREGGASLHVADDAANRILHLPILRLKGETTTTPERVLHTMQVAPSVSIALSKWHSNEVQTWVRKTQDLLWDTLVAHRLRLEADRPTGTIDYAAEIGELLKQELTEKVAKTELESAAISPPLPEEKLARPAEIKGNQHQELPAMAATSTPPTRREQVQEWRRANVLEAKQPAHVAAKPPKAYRVVDGKLVTTRNEKRLLSYPKRPWDSGEAVIGVERDGSINPRFLAWVIQHWLHELSVAPRKRELLTVHFRSVERGPLGGLLEKITPDYPDSVRWNEPPEDKSLRLGSQRYTSSKEKWVVRAYAEAKPEQSAHLAVVLNYSSDLVVAATRSLEDLERLFPALLLAAYSAANYRFTSILAEHEEEFQQAVLDRLLEEEPFFSAKQLEGAPDHGLIAS